MLEIEQKGTKETKNESVLLNHGFHGLTRIRGWTGGGRLRGWLSAGCWMLGAGDAVAVKTSNFKPQTLNSNRMLAAKGIEQKGTKETKQARREPVRNAK